MGVKFNHGMVKEPTYKNKHYLAYMHNSSKVCLVCGSSSIELHHVKNKHLTDRADNRIVPLCPEHHRGEFSPHGFDQKLFYECYSRDHLLKKASEYFKEFEDEKCLST